MTDPFQAYFLFMSPTEFISGIFWYLYISVDWTDMGFYHNPVPNTLTDTLDQPVKELDLMRKFELERWAHFLEKSLQYLLQICLHIVTIFYFESSGRLRRVGSVVELVNIT